MANHGFLPQDGNDITLLSMTRALREAYYLTWPLAIFLVAGGYFLIHKLWRLNLNDLALHNGVEHNASLAHDDADLSIRPSYAPTKVDVPLLEQFMMDSADGKVMTAVDIARARVRREAGYEPGAIDAVHQEIARGEFALVLAIFGMGKAVPVEHLRVWIQEERFPEGWVKPEKRVGFWQAVQLSGDIRNAMKTLREKSD
jgi:hypothetical protein